MKVGNTYYIIVGANNDQIIPVKLIAIELAGQWPYKISYRYNGKKITIQTGKEDLFSSFDKAQAFAIKAAVS